MPITSPGNDDDTGENHQPTLRKNTAEPVEQTLKQNSYGYKRVHLELQGMGITVSAKRVMKLMTKHGMVPLFKSAKRYSSYKASSPGS